MRFRIGATFRLVLVTAQLHSALLCAAFNVPGTRETHEEVPIDLPLNSADEMGFGFPTGGAPSTSGKNMSGSGVLGFMNQKTLD